MVTIQRKTTKGRFIIYGDDWVGKKPTGLWNFFLPKRRGFKEVFTFDEATSTTGTGQVGFPAIILLSLLKEGLLLNRKTCSYRM